MPDALAPAVRRAAPERHGDGGDNIDACDDPACLDIAEAFGLDHLRQPEADAVETDDDGEINEAHEQHTRVLQRRPERVLRIDVGRGAVTREAIGDGGFLARVKPFGFERIVRQEPEDGDTHDERGHGLDDEHPLPSLQAEMAVEPQKP